MTAEESIDREGPVPANRQPEEHWNWWDTPPTGYYPSGLHRIGPKQDDQEYLINSKGFRGREFTGEAGCVGDSFTFGIGAYKPWAELCNLDNLANVGLSNDALVRIAVNYIKFYKPSLFVVAWTYGYRREWITDDGKLHDYRRKFKKFQEADMAFTELHNSAYDYYTWQKNQLLLRCFCKDHDVKLIEVNNHTVNQLNYPVGTDGKHPGDEWHSEMAKIILDK
jgi:hypothetical protein